MECHQTNEQIIENSTPEISPIVAIGASAGGLNAIIQFFKTVPAKSDMTYVVITHLDHVHKSIMPELIQSHNPMPVILIDEGSKLQPNAIYVIPPNKNIMIENDTFSLIPQDKPHYANLPINYFFNSLARAYGRNAIAIVLSGCGADGSLGIRDIKHHDGIVAVQDPTSSDFASMPQNAINTGLADCVATPDKIYQQIKRLLNLNHKTSGNFTNEMQHVFAILLAATGHDFTGYKSTVLKRRIERQMHRLYINNITDYVDYLRLNSNEAILLFTDILIGVTSFFRDSDAFWELKKDGFTRLLNKKPSNYTFRVWVPGCSSGEEAYSLAIILREYMQETKRDFHVQIFATDIDPRALQIARTGVYPSTIEKDISEARLKTWFTKDKTTYKINKDIREMIIFGNQNLIQDPPFTNLDLISCRNLLIYLNAASQQKLFPLFHYSLKSNGILFLGKSESVCKFTHLFSPIGTKCKVFEKNKLISSGYSYSDRPINQNLLKWSSFLPSEKLTVNNQLDIDYVLKEILMDSYILPCVVVDSEGEIIFSHGHLKNFIAMNIQLIHANILNVVQPHIKSVIKPFFLKVGMQQIDTCITKIIIDPFFPGFATKLLITPIHEAAGLHGLILIRFEMKPIQKTSSKKSTQMNKELLDVEEELNITKENLQTTIEELAANNEEMQSTNEEFQSINEELETSKEELQSVNEELLIVNTELQNRIEQLAAVNDDMNNLFNSTDIATIFLDKELSIKRFTPQAQELVHLIPTDIGRSFSHFSTNLKTPRLVENSLEVLNNLKRKTFEVQSNGDRWYLVNIVPYRTQLNIVAGVVITFVDITQNKKDKEEILKLNNELLIKQQEHIKSKKKT